MECVVSLDERQYQARLALLDEQEAAIEEGASLLASGSSLERWTGFKDEVLTTDDVLGEVDTAVWDRLARLMLNGLTGEAHQIFINAFEDAAQEAVRRFYRF